MGAHAAQALLFIVWYPLWSRIRFATRFANPTDNARLTAVTGSLDRGPARSTPGASSTLLEGQLAPPAR